MPATTRPRRRATALAVAVALVGACSPGASDDAVTSTTPVTASTTTTTAATTTTTTLDPLACRILAVERSAVAVADPTLDEISGAAVSPTRPDVLWVHEDSGNEPEIVALDASGATLGRWSIPDVANVDWEDMAAVAEPGPTLFVGDVGDNEGIRAEVSVLRIPEPDPAAGEGIVPARTVIRMVLPAPADVEALLVDPRSGDVVLVTKEVTGRAEVLVAPVAAHGDGTTAAPLPLVRAGTVDLGLFGAVLAGDVSPEGDAVVLRTPSDVWWWPRLDGETLADALVTRDPCRVPSVTDLRGEAVALSPGGGYLLVGEGAEPAIHRVVDAGVTSASQGG